MDQRKIFVGIRRLLAIAELGLTVPYILSLSRTCNATNLIGYVQMISDGILSADGKKGLKGFTRCE